MRGRRIGLVALLLLLSIALPPARSAATPGSGVNSAQETQSSQEGRDFIVRDITVGPGGSTGWHWHDGTLVGAIKQGTLTHYSADCSVDGVYNPGDPVIEPAGPDHVHLGRNLGTMPLILEVIYIQPVGKPAAEDAPNPGCPFA
ncbi:cupin [Mycobacterium florentinum]|uniref:Cupin n=2 Tax=Mycobacterium florentinum TaxID=292462 RepID=A0A1X1UGH7_MYCFL|nr:cupin domain-containing protein [Mycobacterium florentinum]MCV7413076.1 cupin domain-containing protein [Mycobacterium florentinum]ORV55808.1 cupin [Mycobacterium florentinum]